MTKKKKKKTKVKKLPVQEEKALRCVRWLNLSLALGLIYALMLVFIISLSIAAPDMSMPEIIQPIMFLLWAVAKIGFAFSLVCLYQATGYAKWALAAVLLAASAVLPYMLPSDGTSTFIVGIEALAVTGLSLSLFDLGRATNTEMGIPAGMIFLGVILQILQNQLMSYVGVVFLAIGFYLSLKHLWLHSQTK
jgi:general stress protein CsbA